MRPFQYISILFSAAVIILAVLCVTRGVSIWWLVSLCVAYFGVLYFCVTQIQWNYYIQSINNGDRNEKNITLTFDDGPNLETEAILDILKELNVKATFFCIGSRVVDAPKVVQRMYDEGHVVGNHSYSHSYSFDWKSSAHMLEDIESCNTALNKVIGKVPHLFRPPYGITNPNLYRAVSKSGMQSIGWSLRSFDTTIKDKERLKAKVLNNLRGGDIVLLHDSMTTTREILTDIIQDAQQKGFTFVPLTQLVDIKAYA